MVAYNNSGAWQVVYTRSGQSNVIRFLLFASLTFSLCTLASRRIDCHALVRPCLGHNFLVVACVIDRWLDRKTAPTTCDEEWWRVKKCHSWLMIDDGVNWYQDATWSHSALTPWPGTTAHVLCRRGRGPPVLRPTART